MFTARCVPKVYFFCTFSAQNEPDIAAPLRRLFVGSKPGPRQWEMATRLRKRSPIFL
jgi:hypothetical protein